MWPSNYWASSYWTTNYWARPTTALSSACGCSLYGDGSLYGNGELYCSSEFTHESYIVLHDTLCHYLSVRITTTKRFKLDSLRALVMARTVLPHAYFVDVDAEDVRRMSFRIRGTGCLKLTSIRPQVTIRNQQPVM